MSAHFRSSFIRNHASRAGFTLLELVLVLLLLSIFAMLGVPALNSAMGDSRLAGAAQEVVNAFEFAQLRATTGAQTRVVIGDSTDRIAVRQYQPSGDIISGGTTLAAADVETGTYQLVEYPASKGVDYEILFASDRRFKGVDITASDFNVADPVQFDTLGTPTKGGTVTLVLGNRQTVVTLDALSGKVTVSP
jgi:prepilin-type N-terminal cleavage/methylation domain-containing protein